VAPGVGPEFEPQYHKKTKQQKKALLQRAVARQLGLSKLWSCGLSTREAGQLWPLTRLLWQGLKPLLEVAGAACGGLLLTAFHVT
jgi:hypothetical protein